ncbi:cell shape-determining protein [Clostridium sp. C8-1-8]|uniref:cell shape-determining protein n=1 Tax=Clostridium sp. C8-1-8 TaxID=2698831 RepID=UPI00136D3FC7|nr:cell shape-determining protein [Clostridium sp. C8-1-8]
MKKEANSKFFLAAVIFIVLITLAVHWLFLFPLTLGFISTTLFVSIAIIFLSVLARLILRNKKVVVIIPIIILVFLGYCLISSGIFRAKDYKNLIGTIKEETFSKDISPIDITQLPVVDKTYAEKLAEKKLGEAGAIGSQVTPGEPVKQIVKDKLCWIVPLLHSGFFSWSSNREGTPGYIVVSATNADDVTFVKELNGKPIHLKYQPNAFLSDDLLRHTYYQGNEFVGLTDYSFEIDDNGAPYWVITRYKNTIGFSGEKVLGTAIVNAQTGEVKNYDINNTPSWVDRIQPEDIVRKQLNLYGEYIKGFQWFTKNNKLKTTEGGEIIYDKGNCYYYNGLTSVGKDSATIGFTLTNTKTHQTTLYKTSGATEEASIKSAEGKVQNMGYKATSPILINIENVPTYFTTLKDKDGIVRMYGMISVQDYNIVGVGETTKQTLSDYTKALTGKGNLSSLNSSGKINHEQATVLRIGQEITDKTTFYHIITKEKPDVIFVVSADASGELALTQAGDKVELDYIDADGVVINATGFDNLEFSQRKSDTQKKIEKENKTSTEKK